MLGWISDWMQNDWMNKKMIYTFPQPLQWCRRKNVLKSQLHTWHMVTRSSGTHTGAVSPSSAVGTAVDDKEPSRGRKVAFRFR